MDSSSVGDHKSGHNSSQESSYSQCYKNNHRTMEVSLQQRRETFLNEHKEKHSLMFDERRDLSEFFQEYDINEDDLESMEIDKTAPIRKRIKFKVTMSEWFTHIPEDLAEQWIVKFCPLGKRRLVISQAGITKCFNKFGQRLFHFSSSLPGGGTRKSQKEGLTVLDCILNEKTRTFYVLDMLAWNSVYFLNCEAQLRHSWMRSKYLDYPEIFTAYGTNNYMFKVLLDHPADLETIRSEIWQYDSQNEIICDGLIFFHREAPYVSGQTPLVTWLKPFMLPEKLHIEIPEEYEKRRPPNYVDFQSFFVHTTEKRKRKKRKPEKMETEEIPSEQEGFNSNF